MSRQQLLVQAGRLCKARNIRSPFRNGVPGKDWFYGLKRRHPGLVLKSPEALSDVRYRALNPTAVGRYFVELGQVLTTLNLHGFPSRVWNMDETGSQLEHKPSKVCAPKGSNVVGRSFSSKSSVSVLVCVNATGLRMKPMVIVKGKSHRAIQTYNTSAFDAMYTYQQKAWMEDALAEDWFQNVFLAECGPERPQLLILDNHHSHEVLGLLERAKREDIHIIAFPAHTTSKLCPLDVSCFSPLKRAYSRVVTEWMGQSPLHQMTKWQWPQLFGQKYTNAMTPNNIMGGFKATGIFPFNSRAIKASDLVGSQPISDNTHPLEWVLSEICGSMSPATTTSVPTPMLSDPMTPALAPMTPGATMLPVSTTPAPAPLLPDPTTPGLTTPTPVPMLPAATTPGLTTTTPVPAPVTPGGPMLPVTPTPESTPTLTDPTTPGLTTTTPAPTPILPDETTPGSAMFPATTTPLREMLVEVQHTSGPRPDSCMPYIVDICGPLTPAMSDATDTSLHVSIPTELLRPTPTVLTPMPVVPQESGSPQIVYITGIRTFLPCFHPFLPQTLPSNLHQSVFWPVMMSYIKRNCLLK